MQSSGFKDVTKDDLSFASSLEECGNDIEVGDNSSSVGKFNAMNEIRKYIKKENSHVQRWRIIVLTLIVLTGAVVSGLTFMILNRKDEENFTTNVSAFLGP